MNIEKLYHLPHGTGYGVIRNLAVSRYLGTTATYVHLKTNIPLSQYTMATIEAVGYNYGNAAPVRCGWGFYTYGSYIYSTYVQNAYNGLTAHGVYASTDNYVVLRGYASYMYFLNFTLNQYTTPPSQGAGFDVQILAEAYNTNSGSAF